MDGFFSVDIEPDLRTGDYNGITVGLPRLMRLLDKYNIKSTLFVTGKVLDKYPGVFKSLKSRGHEVEIHGYSHKRYDLMTLKEKEEDLKKAISSYRRIFGKKPSGFRAPQHSIDQETLSLLKKLGFKFDSSRVPGNIMLLRHLLKKSSGKRSILNNFFSKLSPYEIRKGITEIPRSAFLISSGGFELKLYPAWTYKLIILISRTFKIPFVFTMHSWDMIKVGNSKTEKMCPPELFEKKLDYFLEYSSKRVNYLRMEDIYLKSK